MKIIHYFTGLLLLVFVGVHIVNHLMILNSESHHLRFMKAARKIYRQPLVEAIIAVSVLLQAVTGIGLVIAKWNKAAGIFDRIQIASGLYLALFLVVHILAVAFGRYKMGIDTNLYYGAGVMNMWPQKLIFIPYYFLALFSFFAHLACVHYHKIGHYISASAAAFQSIVIMSIGLLIAIAIVFRMAQLKNSQISFSRGEKILKTKIMEHQKSIQ